MKRLQQNALRVGLVALALGACSSTRSDMASQSASPPPMASESVASDTAGNMPADASTQPAASSMAGSGATGDMPGTAGTASGTGMPDQSGYTPSPSAAAPNSIVTLIEVLPREQANIAGAPAGAGATSGSSTSGSGASGSTAAGGDKVYRVTLYMDDGSTRVITQETMPNFRAGDRVRLENGMVLR